jgi:hypothetical protein
MKRGAILSPCQTYRFQLTREMYPPADPGTVLFVLNNPSIADAEIDDPTVRRGWGFTRAWGYGRMIFMNVNPYRSTDPVLAKIPPTSVIVENCDGLTLTAIESDVVVCAWGTKAEPGLVRNALNALRLSGKPLHYLELSKDGTPKHPLYLKKSLWPQVWNPPR